MGIHGLHRLREWDAVATVGAPGLHGREAVVVLLRDGTVVVEDGEPGPRVRRALDALRLTPPFRARLLRREGDIWAVAGRALRVVELAPDPGGDEIEVEWDGRERAVRVDGVPRLVPLPELGVVRRGRVAPYAALLRRLHGSRFEAEVAEL